MRELDNDTARPVSDEEEMRVVCFLGAAAVLVVILLIVDTLRALAVLVLSMPLPPLLLLLAAAAVLSLSLMPCLLYLSLIQKISSARQASPFSSVSY